MADERNKKRLVRFDFPPGADAATIANGINELRRRIMDEAVAEQKLADERNDGKSDPEPPKSR